MNPNNKAPAPKNPLSVLDNPISIGAMILIAIAGVAMGWLDGYFAMVLIGIGIFGIVHAQKKAANKK